MIASSFAPAAPRKIDGETEQKLTYNSLVEGHLDHISWMVGTSHPPKARPLSGDSVSGLRSLVYMNSDGYCVKGGYRERPFTVPTGVTGLKLELDEVQRSAIGATGDFALQLYAADGVTQIHSETFSPSASSTNVATSEITVTPGLEYRARIVCNVSAQSQFLCGIFRVRPTTSSVPFWLNFKRLDPYGHIQDSNEVKWLNPRFCPQNEYSPIEFTTNSSFKVESYCTEITYVYAARSAISAYVDGYPFDPLLTPTVDGVNYSDVTISGISDKKIKVQSGIAVKSGYPAPTLEDRGNWISAVYFPASSYVSVVPAPVECAVLYGDSKTAGSYSDAPGRDSLAFLLRKNHWKVIAHAQGGGYIGADVGLGTLTVAACTDFAMKMCAQKPTKIFLAMGRNDFTGGSTPANIVTQLGNLADAIHAVLPSCRVIFTTWTSETTSIEANSYNGVAWDTMRANIITLCSTRSPWCTFIDEARYWTPAEATTYTSDTVHPNSLGYERKALGMISKSSEAQIHHPWSPLQLAPTIWLESRAGLIGGTCGTVTATGTTPPGTVTLSGSATAACHLRIEITTGGTAASGNARFRWSIDNGRSWVQQEVTVASSVLLSSIGVTVNFGAGTYLNNNVYQADTKVATWKDLSGNGNDFTQGTDGARPLFASSAGVAFFEPAVDFSSNKKLQITGLNISSPYTVAIVGKANTQVGLYTMFGRPAGNTGLLLYATDGTHMAPNDGTNQVAVSATMTTRNTVVVVKDGASSKIRVNGTETTGTLGDANPLTGIALGYDYNTNAYWNGSIEAFLLIPRACTAAELLNIEARFKSMYNTP